MTMWWEDATGAYVNAQAIARLEVFEHTSLPGTWLIRAQLAGEFDYTLKGTYPDSASAFEAARKLCQGVDPASITGGT